MTGCTEHLDCWQRTPSDMPFPCSEEDLTTVAVLMFGFCRWERRVLLRVLQAAAQLHHWHRVGPAVWRAWTAHAASRHRLATRRADRTLSHSRRRAAPFNSQARRLLRGALARWASEVASCLSLFSTCPTAARLQLSLRRWRRWGRHTAWLRSVTPRAASLGSRLQRWVVEARRTRARQALSVGLARECTHRIRFVAIREWASRCVETLRVRMNEELAMRRAMANSMARLRRGARLHGYRRAAAAFAQTAGDRRRKARLMAVWRSNSGEALRRDTLDCRACHWLLARRWRAWARWVAQAGAVAIVSVEHTDRALRAALRLWGQVAAASGHARRPRLPAAHGPCSHGRPPDEEQRSCDAAVRTLRVRTSLRAWAGWADVEGSARLLLRCAEQQRRWSQRQQAWAAWSSMAISATDRSEDRGRRHRRRAALPLPPEGALSLSLTRRAREAWRLWCDWTHVVRSCAGRHARAARRASLAGARAVRTAYALWKASVEESSAARAAAAAAHQLILQLRLARAWAAWSARSRGAVESARGRATRRRVLLSLHTWRAFIHAAHVRALRGWAACCLQAAVRGARVRGEQRARYGVPQGGGGGHAVGASLVRTALEADGMPPAADGIALERSTLDAVGMRLKPDGGTFEANGLTVDAPWMTVDTDRTAVDADGSTIEANRTTIESNGLIIDADGMTVEGNGVALTIFDADGTRAEADMSSFDADRTSIDADGSVSEVGGTATDAHGTIFEADAMTIDADGMTVEADGTILEADRRTVDADRMTVEADGMNVEADAMTLEADGMNLDPHGMSVDGLALEEVGAVKEADGLLAPRVQEVDAACHGTDIPRRQGSRLVKPSATEAACDGSEQECGRMARALAAVTLQRHARGILLRKLYRHFLRVCAAQTLQRFERGRQAARFYQRCRASIAAVTLQSHTRGNRARRRYHSIVTPPHLIDADEFDLQASVSYRRARAAVAVQRHDRGRAARRGRVARRVASRAPPAAEAGAADHCATVVQSRARAFLLVRRFRLLRCCATLLIGNRRVQVQAEIYRLHMLTLHAARKDLPSASLRRALWHQLQTLLVLRRRRASVARAMMRSLTSHQAKTHAAHPSSARDDPDGQTAGMRLHSLAHLRMHSAALILQRLHRAEISWRQLKLYRASIIRAALLLQRHARSWLRARNLPPLASEHRVEHRASAEKVALHSQTVHTDAKDNVSQVSDSQLSLASSLGFGCLFDTLVHYAQIDASDSCKNTVDLGSGCTAFDDV
ncbi:hypothetical protein AB1Y20_019216 [Prymnesium parvum]|uniref:Uncharacterized protein n=1 Tax=Prymnesium parvum TaxID=97485 RepID=A0AB34JRQ5_PRYPA